MTDDSALSQASGGVTDNRATLFALKPCPFCGGDATLGTFGISEKLLGISERSDKSRWFYRVQCLDCGVCQPSERYHIPRHTKPSELGKDDSAAEAIMTWNTRAQAESHP
jgi:Lar family restriction alleviation protein